MGPVLTQSRAILTIIRPTSFLVPKRSFAHANGKDEEELKKAREWLANFSRNTIPRSICTASFSRSSGPGGQNVNKVNSKATLKVPLISLLPLVPPIIHERLRSSRYLADRSDSLVIQSDEDRKQSSNLESCFSKLYKLIEASAREVIPGETSQEQKDRVKTLKRAEGEGRLKMKKLQSLKKSSRRGSKYDD
ncbi:peptidyl-tRNA hydrolase domain protein [Talaromyces proteolyticus]|uniref:Peptidyl-tRNA hydrolase domain protein n=1 Tax=Talaromyces proteolyticus TaxID=1131652 RepID=A0AAD4KPD7_9EURO|nr:peptidyl-tRNA hydrolase domain protein [Talaromyces proteolyticus]KAH8693036.1 peptidyl-tRNA hydrolase domain protein [Talaromyces proteolyticus]